MEVASGLLIGVGASVTSSVIIGLYTWMVKRRNRREQCEYIRSLIVSSFTVIRDAENFTDLNLDGDVDAEIDEARAVYAGMLLKEIDIAISYRSSALSAEQMSSLRVPLSHYLEIAGSPKKPDISQGMDYYYSMYESFYLVEWLNLPKNLLGQRA